MRQGVMDGTPLPTLQAWPERGKCLGIALVIGASSIGKSSRVTACHYLMA